MLKRKITEILLATSSSLALITGAVAAIAEPPQIDEPTPTKVAVLTSNFNHFCKQKATIKDVAIVEMIIGNDCTPTLTTCIKLSPKPSKTTAVCKMYFEVKAMPLAVLSRF